MTLRITANTRQGRPGLGVARGLVIAFLPWIAAAILISLVAALDESEARRADAQLMSNLRRQVSPARYIWPPADQGPRY